MYFTDLDSLIAEINKIYNAKLKLVGEEMQAIAKRRYTWSHIAFKYELLVEEALTSSKKVDVEAETKNIPYDQLLELGHAHLKTNLNF